MMNDIQVMFMSFNYYQEVDLKEARELIIYAVKEYLTAINDNQEVRPYLHDYPFTAKNVGIDIFFYNSDGSDLSPDKISCAQCSDGKIECYVYSAESFTMIREESYEEALQAIAAQ